MSFTTSQLASYLGGELIGDATIECEGAEIDSREPLHGKVFFALRGEKVDGHDFVEHAAANGCSAVVVERNCHLQIPAVIVKDVRRALFDLASARRNTLPAEKVIAITGSAGKTTTKNILAHILGHKATSSRKSFNNDLGVPLTLLDAEQAEYIVAEVGANDIGEIQPLAELVQPNIAILTSVGKAHLDGFGNRATVLKEKAALLQSLPAEGTAVVPDTIDFDGIPIAATLCKVGMTDSADVSIQVGVTDEGFGMLELDGHRVVLALFGEHNAQNAALAVVAARCVLPQAKTEELLQLASEVIAPTGRLQRIEVGEIVFFDDSYNANPASMRSALRVFSGITCTRKVLILGDMLELGECAHAEHRLLASSIEQVGADLIVLVGQSMKAAAQLPACIYEPVASEEAIARIASLLQPSDTVLMKGSRGLCLERILETIQRMKVSTR